MNELHLFAGAGGGILGGILLGHTCVCAVEIEPYCRKVLFQRQRDGILPKFPIWDDVKTFDGKPWRGKVDVVCGGFPCQDISAAWKGAGITGERSGLWSEMARIIREVEPGYVLVENSPMLTSRGLGRVLGELATMGFDARWGVFSAADVGARHIRERIWILAHTVENRHLPVRARYHDAKRAWRKPQKWVSYRHFSEMGQAGSTIFGRRTHPDVVARMVDDLAFGMDNIKATGNGQVPAVVKLAWEILSNE
jgi:DNA (cytosine-5)-methyltransferase 1